MQSRFFACCMIAGLIFLLSGPLDAANQKAIGYFYMSGTFSSAQEMSYSHDDDSARATMDTLRSYMTDVHGPFRSRWGAIRAMREQKRKSPSNVYYTRIFKL